MSSPTHVAIIMDGNGRWGIKKKNSRNYGHSNGIKVVESIINAAISKKIKYLTLYTFSTENWKRPKQEVNFLIKLLETYIDKEINKMLKNNIKLKIIGNLTKFPISLKKKLNKAEKLSNRNTKIQINIALNYGSKEEIIKSVKKLYNQNKSINEKNISDNLYTKDIPDPEILIRTGGNQRLSNFMLWQLAYTELFFLKKLWPDFKPIDLKRIIKKFKKIKRNYGAV